MERLYYKVLHSQALEELREVVSQYREEARREQRSWGEFVEKLSIPKGNKMVISKRMVLNLNYYRVNYAMLTAASFGFSALFFTLRLVLVLAFSLGLAFYLFHLKRDRPIVVMGYMWTFKDRLTCMASSTFLVATFFGSLRATLVGALFAVSAISLHSALRPKSTRSEFTSLGESVNLEEGITMQPQKQEHVRKQATADTVDAVGVRQFQVPQTGEYDPEASSLEMERRRRAYVARNEEYARQRSQVLGKTNKNVQQYQRFGSSEEEESKDADELERERATAVPSNLKTAPVNVNLHIPGRPAIFQNNNIKMD